jgi:hypothetical protein
VAVGIDAGEPIAAQTGVVVGRDAVEAEVSCCARAERLGDGSLTLDEIGVAVQQLDLGLCAQVRAQRDQSFEARNPAAGDDDPGASRRAVRLVGPRRGSAARWRRRPRGRTPPAWAGAWRARRREGSGSLGDTRRQALWSCRAASPAGRAR